MAGTFLGASAPVSPPPALPGTRRPYRVPGTTRTRRNHGVFMLGQEVASVYSTRRGGAAPGVSMTVGNGTHELAGTMSPTQARQMAHALLAAAAAVDALQGVGEAAALRAEGGAA